MKLVTLLFVLCGICFGQGQLLMVVPPGTGVSVPAPDYAWNFNDCSGTTITAQAGGQNGTLVGTVNVDYTWVNDSGNCSVSFPHAAGAITFGSLFDSIATRTFLWWQNVTSAGSAGNRRIFNKDGTSVQAWQIQHLTTTAFRMTFRNAANSANETWDTGNGAYTLSTWQCRAVIVNCPDLDAAQCAQFYDNTGSTISTTVTTNQTGARLTTSSKIFRAANDGNLTVGTDSILDGIKIWNSALTGPQIAVKCGEGKP